nr:zf-CCHC domain-containing protein/DUF4219 domain-containing protein/UBN2 domain-containing protein [Tanacetum cinerariifolium]
FETYVKSKDLDLWHVITNGDFQPIQQNPKTKLDEVIPYEKQSDDLKKKLAKNNEAKMVIYNALPRKEYEIIFMCNMTKEILKTLLITHQDNAFARFSTIITSLKALDEGYSSKNYVRKFLRALHPKWRAKVTTIKELKDLTSFSLDELIWNLKVYEMIIKKDFEIVKAKGERKTLALKAKKESSDEERSTSGSEDEEYLMAVRDFKKFFKRRGDRKCFRCGDPNHLIGEFPKPPKDKNQRAFVRGSWSDSGEEDDEKVKDKTCLMTQASNEVRYESSYFNDENSSIDDLFLDNKYDKLRKMSLKIITKNKRLKATRNSLEKELSILKEKVFTLEKNKGVDLKCVKCHMLKIENEKLKDEAIRLTKCEKSTHCLNEMLSNQKHFKEKLGFGFNSFEASSSRTKKIKFVKAQKKAYSDGGPINMGGPHIVQAALKDIMRPSVITPGSEKSVSFQKSILADMSLASSAVTYTSVYTDSKSGRVFWGADEELSDGGPEEPQTPPALQDKDEHKLMFIQPHNHEFVPEPIYPEYIPLEDEHILSAEEYQLPPVASPYDKLSICLGVDLEPDEWIKDNGCSKHMTGNQKLFSNYKAYNGGNVIFSSNLCGNIIGKGTISNDSLKIDNVEHADNLRFNLLSVGKIYDNKCRVTFSEHDKEITKDGKVIGRGIRKKGLYVMKLENKPKDKICVATIDENSTLWHRRLGHANMHLIQLLASKELVRNLPNKHTRKIKESLNVTFDKTPPPSKTSALVDDDLDKEEAIKVTEKKNLENDSEDETLEIDEIVNIKESRNHPLENVIGKLD